MAGACYQCQAKLALLISTSKHTTPQRNQIGEHKATQPLEQISFHLAFFSVGRFSSLILLGTHLDKALRRTEQIDRRLAVCDQH
jgi:hypothetical protein